LKESPKAMVQAAIETLLQQKIGLDANSIGSRSIARAIDQRRAQCGLPTASAYWHHLQSSLQELDALIEAVVIPETWFFRDKEPFVRLRQYVMQEWKKTSFAKTLRVLSVPCSTGEEPYSIAMTLLDAGLTPKQFSIEAIDISQRALLKAKLAVYSKRSFRGGEINSKRQYFQEENNCLKVRSEARNTVLFKQANVLEPGLFSPGKYHVIFCRNLLIYLDSISRDRVMQTLDLALAPSGLLFVGAVETVQVSSYSYIPIPHQFAFAYRKPSPSEKSIPPAPLPDRQVAPVPLPQSGLCQMSDRQVFPVESNLDRAKQCADRGQMAEAVRYCEAYVSEFKTNANAYLLLGEIYQGLDRFNAAEQAYQKAIYLNPHAFEAMIQLSLLKEQRGDRTGSELLRQRAQRVLAAQDQGRGWQDRE
jgi:chemotaxis protein methyltransferase WspC